MHYSVFKLLLILDVMPRISGFVISALLQLLPRVFVCCCCQSYTSTRTVRLRTCTIIIIHIHIISVLPPTNASPPPSVYYLIVFPLLYDYTSFLPPIMPQLLSFQRKYNLKGSPASLLIMQPLAVQLSSLIFFHFLPKLIRILILLLWIRSTTPVPSSKKKELTDLLNNLLQLSMDQTKMHGRLVAATHGEAEQKQSLNFWKKILSPLKGAFQGPSDSSSPYPLRPCFEMPFFLHMPLILLPACLCYYNK